MTAPSYPFQVGTSTSTGNGAFLSGAGVWTNASDRRVKENIQPIPYGLAAVEKLKPVAYDMIGTHEKQVGFIAQDVLQVVPEVVAVPEHPETQHYGLSYGNMLAVAVRAIQELKAIIDRLVAQVGAHDDQIKALQETVKAQQQQINALKQQIEHIAPASDKSPTRH